MVTQFLKFVVRGIIGGIVDTAVLWLLSSYVFASYLMVHILAPAISFELSLFVTYTICYFWIWNHRVHGNARDFFHRLPGYNLTVLLSLIVKLMLIQIIEHTLPLDSLAQSLHMDSVVIGNFIALFFSGFVNFYTGEKIIFKAQPADSTDEKYIEND